jgi:hypothetical protein
LTILLDKQWPGVDLASDRNEYQEYFLGGKGSWCIGLTTFPPSCADCLEIWERQHPGTLWACNGIALPVYSLRYHKKFFMTTPSVEMTEGVYTYIVKLPDIFYFWGQIFISCIFSVSVLGRFWVKGTARFLKSVVLFSLLMSSISGLLKYTVMSVTIDLSHYTSVMNAKLI